MNGIPLISDTNFSVNPQARPNKIIAVIQARALSERLPRKIFAKLDDKRSILSVIIENLHRTSVFAEIWVATAEPGAEEIEKIASEKGALTYVGDPVNVLSRFTEIARKSDADYIVRATGDNPFVDPSNPIEVSKLQLNTDADVAAYTGLPLGTAVESFKVESLLASEQKIKGLPEKERCRHEEHVSTFMKQNRQDFHIAHHPWPYSEDLEYPEKLRLTIDEQDDLILARKIVQVLERENHWPVFRLRDILDIINRYPRLTRVNSHIQQRSYRHYESLNQFQSRLAISTFQPPLYFN